MTSAELRDEKEWLPLKQPLPMDRTIEALTFKEQIELEDEAIEFARRMQSMGKADQKADPSDDSVGDLAEELSIAFKIIDRIVWFLREFDIEGIELPDEIEKESTLLYREAKAFVDRMEYGFKVEIKE
jgi:hypothetical protein